MARPLRPRPPLAIAPVFVTQKTSFAVLGIDERPFLEQVVPLCEGHVVSLGKLRAIPVDVVLERLRSKAAAGSTVPSPVTTADDQPESADGVLKALGLRRAS